MKSMIILNRKRRKHINLGHILFMIPFIILLFLSHFSVGPTILLVVWLLYTLLSVSHGCNTVYLYQDHILIKNLILRDKSYFFKDIKEITVYRKRNLSLKHGSYYLIITLHDKLKEGCLNKKIGHFFDYYQEEDMEIIYNELRKRDVECTYV
jgi:hypothetical protein